MLTIIKNSDAVAQWVARRVELPDWRAFGPCATIGIARDGRPVAGAVYNWFHRGEHGGDIRITVAAEPHSGWATRAVLRELSVYPFMQMDCSRVTAIIREGNTESERVCRKAGFRKEGVLRRAWDGKTNAIVYGLLKSECRWLNG